MSRQNEQDPKSIGLILQTQKAGIPLLASISEFLS